MTTKLDSASLASSIIVQLFLLVQFGSAQTAAPSPPTPAMLSAKIDEYMNAATRAEHFSGSILVAQAGRPIISKGYGMANIELGAPNTPNTVFPDSFTNQSLYVSGGHAVAREGEIEC